MKSDVSLVLSNYDQTRAEQAARLSAQIPLNSLGLATGFWRYDLLPCVVVEEINPADLEAAWVPLDYSNGYPALPNGDVFWSRLHYESDEDHEEFQKYVGMGSYRILPKLVNGYSLDRLQYLSYINYWYHRARAYDVCEKVARQSKREQLIYELEADHLAKAASYLKIADEYICGDKFKAEMTPRDAINLAKLAVQISRVSLQLPSFNPPEREATGQVINVEQLTVLHKEDKTQVFVEQVLVSPEVAESAQDLAVKLMSQSNSPSSVKRTAGAVIDVESAA